MLIESYKAKAHLDRMAKFDPTTIKADSSLEEALELMYGPRPMMSINAGVAIIPVKGVIGIGVSEIEKMMGCVDVEDIEEMLEVAERHPDVKKIVFAVNSPGGTVTGVPELAKRIRSCRKNTYAYIKEQACSGGFWLASQCDEVWVAGSAIVANIGCFIAILNEQKAYEMEGYKVELFKSGWAKAAGFPGTETTPEQKALFNADAKETHDWFIKDVLSTRSMAKVEDMQGQCWSGRLAASKMLVTGVKDTLDDFLMYLGGEIYTAFESEEPPVGYTIPYSINTEFVQFGKTVTLNAEVQPEQGNDDEDEKDAKPISESKKKKKSDGDDEDDEIGEKELPDDPGTKPIITDDKTK